jgi:hypothetical protein
MPAVLALAFLAGSGVLIWALASKPSARRYVSAPAAPVVKAAKVTPATAFVVLGDSLAVGLQPYLEAWAAANRLPCMVDAAVGRFTRQQGADAVVPGALVFVSLGTNDATSRVDGSLLRMLADDIRARGARAIVWLDPPATKTLPGLAAIHETIWSMPGVVAVGTSAPVRSDGLHPSSYAAVFRDIEPALVRAR